MLVRARGRNECAFERAVAMHARTDERAVAADARSFEPFFRNFRKPSARCCRNSTLVRRELFRGPTCCDARIRLTFSSRILRAMPRPHSFPRRKVPDDKGPFPALRLRPPPARPLSSLNVQRADKAIFDALQAWWSYRDGRSMQQCEAFTVLLDVALRSGDPRVAGLDLRVSDIP